MSENVSEEAPFPLTDVDRFVLSQTDEEFTYHTWDELCQLIRMIMRLHCYQPVGQITDTNIRNQPALFAQEEAV